MVNAELRTTWRQKEKNAAFTTTLEQRKWEWICLLHFKFNFFQTLILLVLRYQSEWMSCVCVCVCFVSWHKWQGRHWNKIKIYILHQKWISRTTYFLVFECAALYLHSTVTIQISFIWSPDFSRAEWQPYGSHLVQFSNHFVHNGIKFRWVGVTTQTLKARRVLCHWCLAQDEVSSKKALIVSPIWPRGECASLKKTITPNLI